MEYGELMLGWQEDWPKLFENILWRDETVFHIGGFVNRHNCHYWKAYNPYVTVEKMQNRPKVTVWSPMTAIRVIGPYLLRDTMNAERYLQLLEDYVWPNVSGWESIDELVFMHDGAPPHFAPSVGAWLNQKFPGRWRGQRGPHEWPAKSPDLSPVHFSCGVVQRMRCNGQNLAQRKRQAGRKGNREGGSWQSAVEKWGSASREKNGYSTGWLTLRLKDSERGDLF